uniref:Complement factor H like 4 n=1 Tax=Myripristis murdjan TaxID=586833 RepID=A0A668AB77_9TELE
IKYDLKLCCLLTHMFQLNLPVCLKPPDIPHASVSEESRKRGYEQGDLLYYTCDTGYVSGPTITYICSSKSWKPVRAGELKPCELPDDTPNGYYQIIQGDDFVFGTTIKYFCNSGYQMVSKVQTRTCLLNKWTNHVPICEPVSCSPPTVQEGLIVRGLPDNDGPILSDRFITFSCADRSKYLSGSSELICGQDGEWSGTFPSCEDITCQAQKPLPPLYVTGLPPANEKMKYGHKLRFLCDSRYTLFGVTEVECLETGQWSAAFPTCREPVGCGMPPPLEFGDVQSSLQSSYDHGERVEYSCQSYYTLDGQTHKTCSNGQWTGEMRCIRPCTVTQDDMRRKNIELRYKSDPKIYSRHRDFVTFSCTRGRHDGRLAMRQQCIDGEMLLPSCQ